MNLKIVANAISTFLRKNSPQILAATASIGVVATAVVAVQATPKAMRLVDEARNEHGDISKVDAVRAAWKAYIPAAVVGASTIACIIGGTGVSIKRCATLAAAYSVSESRLHEYKQKVLETVGAEKAQEVQNHISEAALKPTTEKVLPSAEKHEGDTLLYDIWSGRYFYGDRNTVDRMVNQLNQRLLADESISLNEFYEAIGLDCNKSGNEVGWNLNDGLIELRYSAQVASNGEPCLVIDFFREPTLMLPW